MDTVGNIQSLAESFYIPESAENAYMGPEHALQLWRHAANHERNRLWQAGLLEACDRSATRPTRPTGLTDIGRMEQELWDGETLVGHPQHLLVTVRRSFRLFAFCLGRRSKRRSRRLWSVRALDYRRFGIRSGADVAFARRLGI